MESTTQLVIWSTMFSLTMRAIPSEVAEKLAESFILAFCCFLPRTVYVRVITTDNSSKIIGYESEHKN